MEKGKKKTPLNWIINILIFVCLAGVVFYSYKLITWKIHVIRNDELQKKTGYAVTVVETEQGEGKETESEYRVDFDSLKAINEDVVAYVKVNNTNIDYVVVRGSNNDYYLRHNLEKQWNVGGWVFGDYRNKFDGTDKNIILYGHNMTDGSMFGTLNKTLSEEWYSNEENHEIVLVTERGTSFYQVFSTYTVEPEEYYITVDFDNMFDFQEFGKTLKDRSVHDFGVQIYGNEKILTLSSCVGNGEKRVVLHAKLTRMVE